MAARAGEHNNIICLVIFERPYIQATKAKGGRCRGAQRSHLAAARPALTRRGALLCAACASDADHTIIMPCIFGPEVTAHASPHRARNIDTPHISRALVLQVLM